MFQRAPRDDEWDYLMAFVIFFMNTWKVSLHADCYACTLMIDTQRAVFVQGFLYMYI